MKGKCTASMYQHKRIEYVEECRCNCSSFYSTLLFFTLLYLLYSILLSLTLLCSTRLNSIPPLPSQPRHATTYAPYILHSTHLALHSTHLIRLISPIHPILPSPAPSRHVPAALLGALHLPATLTALPFCPYDGINAISQAPARAPARDSGAAHTLRLSLPRAAELQSGEADRRCCVLSRQVSEVVGTCVFEWGEG